MRKAFLSVLLITSILLTGCGGLPNDPANSNVTIANTPVPVTGNISATIPTPVPVKVVNSDNVAQGLSMSSRGELRVHSTSLIENIGIHGTWEGHQGYAFNVMGQRTVWASTSALNDVVPFDTGNTTYTEMTGLENLEVVSTSTSDNLSGTGAQKLVIVYLNLTDNLTESAEVSMNGTTPVSLSFKAHAIEWMEVTQIGSNTVSVGNIFLRQTGTATQYEVISAGGNKSLSGRFRVPAGYRGFLESWSVTCVAGGTQYADTRLRTTTNTLTGVKDMPYHFVDAMYTMGGSSVMNMPLPFIEVPPLGDVKVSAIPSANNIRLDTSFVLVLIAN